jgi:Flp pilus assembly protein protease CpaA
MIPIWLHVPLVLVLALVSWISGMDTTGNPTETSLLWAATALAAGQLVFRLRPRAR